MYTETRKLYLVYSDENHKKYNCVLTDHVVDVGRKYYWKAPLRRNPTVKKVR